MSAKFHFISGLPRSGSTLLAGILRQNPRFHAAMSSPVSGLMNAFLEQVATGSEFSSFFDEAKRKTMCRSIFSSYYDDKLACSIIFDTSRIWTARMHQLSELFTDYKMICLVRNPAWIMDSFERIYRKNPFDYSRMFNPATRATVYNRCEALISSAGPVGSAWSALKEAYYGEYSEKLLLVDYDILIQHPQKTMELMYQFLDIKYYCHDFENVSYEETTFDENLGVKGLHTVRNKVQYESRRSILPPDLFIKYSEMNFWQDNTGTESSCIVSKKAF